MAEIANVIDLHLPEKLHDPEYRRKFFLAEAAARIAEQLIALRKRRGLSQTEVADIVGTRQPAISRAEQADYQSWSFTALRRIAGALDARIRVLIEPSEDILREYDAQSDVQSSVKAEFENTMASPAAQVQNFNLVIPADQALTFRNSAVAALTGPWMSTGMMVPYAQFEPINYGAGLWSSINHPKAMVAELHRDLARKNQQIVQLTEENKLLREARTLTTQKSLPAEPILIARADAPENEVFGFVSAVGTMEGTPTIIPGKINISH